MPRPMYAKSGGKWWQVYPTPAVVVAPVLTATAGDAQVVLTWTAATGATVLSYEVEKDGVVENVGSVLTKTYTGLTNGQAYSFRVRAVVNYVSSPWSNTASATPAVPWNAATGGTETTVTNYNGTGQTWKVHTFNGSGTFTVTKAAQPFSVLVCGAGSPGGTGTIRNGGGGAGGGGAGGKYLYNAAAVLPASALSVVVGTNGGVSTLGSLSSADGVAGGAPNSAGVKLTISGAEVGYCGGGGNGGYQGQDGNPNNPAAGAPGYDGGGKGGDSQADYIANYGPGEPGVRGGGGGGGAGANSVHGDGDNRAGGGSTGTVVVAYRIG